MAIENIRPFQIGLLAVFALIGVISLAILASTKGGSSSSANPYGSAVTIWGVLDSEIFNSEFQNISKDDKNFSVVKYIHKNEETFYDELVNAIAEGRGPDAVLIEGQDLAVYRSKLQPISYTTISQRSIKDNYIDGVEIFALSDGLYAIPFAVDPLIMYWNRDIYSSAGLATPPSTWEALAGNVKQLTLRDASRNLNQSTVAFGEYRNVTNAKAVLLMLLAQSGSKLITEDATVGYQIKLDESLKDDSKPLTTVLQFFVEFSNINSSLYSWNRSITDDLSSFVEGKLALYFGYGSEAATLSKRNPNFNFDVAPVPQGAAATIKRTSGKFYGFAILKSSSNQSGTYQALIKLSGGDISLSIIEAFNLTPVFRSVIAAGVEDPNRQLAYDQALIARSWLDPNQTESDEIFKTMVEDIVSNRKQISESVSDALKKLQLAF